MPIISVRDNENKRLKRNEKKKQRHKRARAGGRSYRERLRAKWFCYAFKLGFLSYLFAVACTNLVFSQSWLSGYHTMAYLINI